MSYQNFDISLTRSVLAIPFLVFGVEHFVYAPFVATIVPSWIAWHPFWVYFCGAAIFATGLSLLTGQLTTLSSTLLGTVILSWVVLIHAPFLWHALHPSWDSSLLPPLDRPLNLADTTLGGRLINCFQDIGMAGALFIVAGRQTLGRVLLGVAFWAFGVLHFAFPAFAPGIPPIREAVQFPVPYHAVWVYATGAAFVIGGVCLIINRDARLAATCLFWLAVVFGLITWVPVFFVKPIQLTGNWLKALGDASGLMMLTLVSDPSRWPAPAAATPLPHADRRSPAAQE